MQLMQLFLDPACFNRLAALFGIDDFSRRARTIILRTDPHPLEPDPVDDEECPLGRIYARIDDESMRSRSARPGSLRVRVDGIERARIDGDEDAPMLLEEHASLVEIVATAEDSSDVVVATYVLTYDGRKQKKERWDVELPWSDRDRLTCSFKYGADDCVGAMFERYRRPSPTRRPAPTVGSSQDQPLVILAVEGVTLEERLLEGSMTLIEAFECLAKISEAIAACHRVEVIHRDLTPSSILFVDSDIRILDFGIARDVEYLRFHHFRDVRHVPYIAPESFTSPRLDARCDVYSLGVMAYETLARTLHFDFDVAAAFDADAPVPLVEINPCVPADLSAVVTRATRRDPADRFANADAFFDAWLECDTSVRRSTESLKLNHFFAMGLSASLTGARLEALYESFTLSACAPRLRSSGAAASETESHANRVFAVLMFDRNDDEGMEITEKLWRLARRDSCLASPELWAREVDRLVLLEHKAALEVLARADERGLVGQDAFECPLERVEHEPVRRHRRAIESFERWRSEIAGLTADRDDERLVEMASRRCAAPQDWRNVVSLARRLASQCLDKGIPREGIPNETVSETVAAGDRLMPKLKLRPSVGAAVKALLEKRTKVT
jgi:hypothetical protein